MPFYKPGDPKAIFTGFGLNEPPPEPDEDDDESPEPEHDGRGETQRLAQSYGITVDRLEDIWAQFRANQVYMNLANVATAICYCFGVQAALKSLSIHLAEKDDPAVFRVMYQPAIWWGAAGVGCFCLAWEITIQIWSMFTSRQTISLYREWVKGEPFEYKGGLFRNQLRFWHWCAVVVVLPVSVASILALNMHSNLGMSSMRVCGYAFKPCVQLDYSDIQHVEFHPAYGHGKGYVGSKVVVDFSGTRKWDSMDWYGGDVDPEVARFLMTKDPARPGSAIAPDLPAN
jgi:hypothetical protein